MVLSAKTRDLAYQGPYSRASTDHEQCSSNKSQHHLYGHHINQFEIETFNSFSPRSNLGESFKKKQHFIHGRPPCGSSHNFLTYGGIPATAPQVTSRHLDAVGSTGGTLETSMHHNATEKSTGFLYGKYDTAVGQPLPRKMKEKDRLPSWMMDKTSAELRKREIQSHEIEEDLARSRLEKANQRAHDLAEQKKDLNMLRNYRPWGKPGGGAPRGVENERASTIRTRQIEQLSADTSQVLPFGRPGAGAPNRTESGKIKAKLSSDKQKKAYDERFRTGKSKRLMPGDTVMLLDNTSRGLSEKYIGPFMIVDIVNSNCQIRSLLNGKEKRVHYNRLKPFELALDEALLQESASVVTSDLESSDSENKEDHVIIHRRDRRNDFVLPDDMQMNSREPEITFVERADENIVDLPNAASKRTSTRSRRPVERYGVSVTDY